MDDKLESQSPSKPSSTLYGRLKFRLLQQAYFTGYAKKQIPRCIRRLLARTEIHRAWLDGYNGCFTQDGIKYGPANPYSAEKHDSALMERFGAAEFELPC